MNSLTSVACKLLETIVKEQVVVFLEEKLIVSQEQHGFVKGRSCLTNLLEVFEHWTRSLDEGYGVDVVYLDYRKALILYHTNDCLQSLEIWDLVVVL